METRKNKRLTLHKQVYTYIYKLLHRLQLNGPECDLTHNLHHNEQLVS